MKHLTHIVIGALLIIFSGCTGIKTESHGLENKAMLQFIGRPGDYRKDLEVKIDDAMSFTGEVVKPHSERPKGKVYAIPTGMHLLTIRYQDEIIYKKKIFVSAQETKKIKLP